jgi:hypothetical protein
MENKRTLLQKILGDDNVLVVKFMVPSDKSTDFYRQHYHKIAEDGIILGLRRYDFFGEFLIIQNLFGFITNNIIHIVLTPHVFRILLC